MTPRYEFEDFLEELYNSAVIEFKMTGKHKSLQEKLEKMYNECDAKIKGTERDFVEDCFDLINNKNDQREEFVYRQGF